MPVQSKRCWSVSRKRMLGRLTAAARAGRCIAAAAPSWTKLLRVSGMASHDELQAELKPARIVRPGDRPHAERVDVVTRQVERGRVREVERLGPELQPPPLSDREALPDRKVDVPQSGT